MTRLTVLYDATCGLCVRSRSWLQTQPKWIELEFLPARSPEARRRYPELVGEAMPKEPIVVSDEGGIYRGAEAWIMCLYALVDYREWSLRLARPALLPLARRVFEWVSENRRDISRRLLLAAEENPPEGAA